MLPLTPAGTRAASPEDGERQRIVASLEGRAIIREEDLSDYSAAQACYGPEAIASRKASLMRLLEAAIADEAMRTHDGPAPSAADLKADSERIDRETRAPEILACIKKHFENNPSRYLKIFVWSSLVESRFRLFLMSDPGVQEPPNRVIGDALNTVAPGVVLGIGIAIGAERFIAALLFGFKARDPLTYGAVAACLRPPWP